MNDQIMLHRRTDTQIKALFRGTPHAILVIGPLGSGKQTVAEYLASHLLDVPGEKLARQTHYIQLIKPAAKSEIPIDAVREMIRALRLKAASRRVVLITDAHFLSEEAQNALLKALEEPPPGTVFLMTALTSRSLLPTIVSRSQKLNLYPISKEQAHKFFKQNFSTKDIDGAWNLSRGHAGLMSAILKDKNSHQLKQAVDQAKLFLNKDKYERLLFLDGLTGDKEQLAAFLDALGRVYAALSDAAIQKGNKPQARKLVNNRKLIHDSLQNINKNASARLICFNLGLSLSV